MVNFDSLLFPPFFLKIIFIIISLGFVFGIFYFLLKTKWLKRLFLKDLFEFFTFRPYEMRKVPKRWQKIVNRLAKEVESETKLAIIEADDLLNEILGKMGKEGRTLGEKLKRLSKETLPNLDEVWEAHQIRSNIAHDPSYRLSLDKAREILGIYKKALLDLEAI